MVWEIIKNTLKDYDAICVASFISHHYYDVPLQQVARVFDVSPKQLQRWFRKIGDDVRTAYRARGGAAVGDDGRYVAYTGDDRRLYIHEHETDD